MRTCNSKVLNPVGFYVKQLNEDIILYLQPWLGSSEAEEEFGKVIYQSEVLGYIQQLDYVEFVTEFSIVRIDYNKATDAYSLFDTAEQSESQTGNTNTNGTSEKIQPLYPWSIITSVHKHEIVTIQDARYARPEERNISNMKVESDLLIEE